MMTPVVAEYFNIQFDLAKKKPPFFAGAFLYQQF